MTIMEFMIGCNYWASNAGTEMWKEWSEEAVREDMEILSAHGVEYLRVFPNWRDFQPVMPVYKAKAALVEYRLEGDRIPENPYFLEETMMERFETFCRIGDEYGMKLIVGLITGWMSGRLFVPSALFDKNLYSDPVALYFQQKYVQGMVTRLKEQKSIYAWDLGNECNCLCPAENRYVAETWTAAIANTIRANDDSRPIISGMHSLGADDQSSSWTIKGQAESCDILTTHPYPLWVKYAYHDRAASYRTAMHGTCETKYYADLGNKLCLAEEIGTMGPMLCSNDRAADFMRVNLFSNWANGSKGVLWWCANEQTDLKTVPYTHNMCEIELGMIDRHRKPKPVLEETGRVAKVLKELPFQLPPAQEDAVCILTKGQEQWGVAYMTYCLAKQAGLNLRFAWCNDKLPDAKLYLIPSTCGINIMPRENYLALKEKVANGATLYISNDTGIWAEFEELTGMRVIDSGKFNDHLSMSFDGETIPFTRTVRYELESVGAKVLSFDSQDNPAISENAYGQGKVYYVNFPLEEMLLKQNNAFDDNFYVIYKKLFCEEIQNKLAQTDNPYIGITLHPDGTNCAYCVAINYSPREQMVRLKTQKGVVITQVYYGEFSVLKPFEAAVFRIQLQE